MGNFDPKFHNCPHRGLSNLPSGLNVHPKQGQKLNYSNMEEVRQDIEARPADSNTFIGESRKQDGIKNRRRGVRSKSQIRTQRVAALILHQKSAPEDDCGSSCGKLRFCTGRSGKPGSNVTDSDSACRSLHIAWKIYALKALTWPSCEKSLLWASSNFQKSYVGIAPDHVNPR